MRMKRKGDHRLSVFLLLMCLVGLLSVVGTWLTDSARSNAYPISRHRLLYIESDRIGICIALAHYDSNQIHLPLPGSNQTSRVWFHKQDDVNPVIFLGYGDANASSDPNVHWSSAPSMVLYVQPILGWILFALMFVIAGIRWLRTHRFPSGFCRACGYDLRASRERCPECGTRVEPSKRIGIKTPSA